MGNHLNVRDILVFVKGTLHSFGNDNSIIVCNNEIIIETIIVVARVLGYGFVLGIL